MSQPILNLRYLLALALLTFASGFSGVSMECVTSFNWNTGNTDIFGSATNGDADCDGGWSASGTKLTLTGTTQPRMFFKKNDGSVLTFNMATDTVSWWSDASELGASFNGALYSSWTNASGDAAGAARWYCDANDGAGNGLWCPEFDMLESNLCGLRSTSHGCVTNASGNNRPDPASPWPVYCDLEEYSNSTDCNRFCARGGDGVWFTSAEAVGEPCAGAAESCEYGAGYTIDPARPVHALVAFSYAGEDLVAFTTTLSQPQGSVLVLSQQTSFQAYPGGFPATGTMGLLAQLWNETDPSRMSWLGGADCPYAQGEGNLPAARDAAFTLWDIKINDEVISFM